MARVIVALSGGVDSAVAAALLREEGHDVIGVTMRIWDGEPDTDSGRHVCYGPDEADIEDAGRVCRTLGIPFHVFDLSKEYQAEVLEYVRSEYLSGRTPNPCVRCNRRVKLGLLVDLARDRGIQYDRVATGHYARVEWSPTHDRFLLMMAIDTSKDQSYFLFALSQQQLGRALFPLGVHLKRHVKDMAASLGLGISDKPESQDFAPVGYASLLDMPQREGPVRDRHGSMLGTHRGVHLYTIGQRKGLGLAGREAMYVTSVDARSNTVTIGTRDELFSDEFTCSSLNWIATPSLRDVMSVTAKIRYNHKGAEATITPGGGDSLRVKFREPQMALAPGQAAVFYDGDVVVGGGTID